MTNDNSDDQNKKSQHENEEKDKEKKRWKIFWDKLNESGLLSGKTRNIEVCLGITKGKFKEILSGKREFFPTRYQIINLYTNIIHSNRTPSQLSEEKKAKLKELNIEDLDSFLRFAGFMPEKKEKNEPRTSEEDQSKNYNDRVHRIACRLSSKWISDENFWQIEEAIINEIQKNHLKTKENDFSILGAETWLKENFDESHTQIQEKFKSSLERYASLGKSKFNEIELFELAQSILENLWFKQKQEKTGLLPSIRIVNVDFQSLTKSLEFLREKNSVVFQQIQNSGRQVESKIIKSGNQENSKNITESSDPNSEESTKISTSISLTEATITCRLETSETEVKWRYSSTASHIETMLEALHHGLGYPSLKLSGLSVRSLGKKANSLARVSVSLTDEKSEKIYYGLWVDQNTITAILQAVVVAVKHWLSDTMQNSSSKYQEICTLLAQIFEDLNEGRKALNDYNFDSEYFKKVIKKIEEVTLQLNRENLYDYLNNCYKDRLEYHKHMAELMLSRSAHIKGDMTEARNNLDFVKAHKRIDNQYDPISILYASEEIIYKFFSEDKDFLKDYQLRNNDKSFKFYQTKIEEYISSEKSTSKENFFFDFDLYLCISEIYGNFGRLELYFWKTSEDRKYLEEEAINNFLVAAYFSLKIGNMQRVAHWLTHVSRAYSRLGADKAEDAKNYVNVAGEIVEQLISPKYNVTERTWRQAEYYLALGEYYLHCNDKQIKAKDSNIELSIENFCLALKGAMILSFCRLIADSLYGIYRSIKLIDKMVNKQKNEEKKSKMEKMFNTIIKRHLNKEYLAEITDLLGKTNNGHKDILENNKNLLSEIVFYIHSDSQQINWLKISSEFKEGAKYVWRTLANQRKEQDSLEVKHPIEVEIDEDSFLAKLPSSTEQTGQSQDMQK
ncbi:hypothetical protein BCD67_13515 [Oscillatoriales cyanobacterium USR001]|nr:hypothetical protein BCD67_13515 [Oscillatoriales cyanobacterium USR001]